MITAPTRERKTARKLLYVRSEKRPFYFRKTYVSKFLVDVERGNRAQAGKTARVDHSRNKLHSSGKHSSSELRHLHPKEPQHAPMAAIFSIFVYGRRYFHTSKHDRTLPMEGSSHSRPSKIEEKKNQQTWRTNTWVTTHPKFTADTYRFTHLDRNGCHPTPKTPRTAQGDCAHLIVKDRQLTPPQPAGPLLPELIRQLEEPGDVFIAPSPPQPHPRPASNPQRRRPSFPERSQAHRHPLLVLVLLRVLVHLFCGRRHRAPGGVVTPSPAPVTPVPRPVPAVPAAGAELGATGAGRRGHRRRPRRRNGQAAPLRGPEVDASRRGDPAAVRREADPARGGARPRRGQGRRVRRREHRGAHHPATAVPAAQRGRRARHEGRVARPRRRRRWRRGREVSGHWRLLERGAGQRLQRKVGACVGTRSGTEDTAGGGCMRWYSGRDRGYSGRWVHALVLGKRTGYCGCEERDSFVPFAVFATFVPHVLRGTYHSL